MIDSRHRLDSSTLEARHPEARNLESRTLDNYADLLALAGMVRASGACVACGPDAAPHRAEHLWLVHDGRQPDPSSPGLLCTRHALAARDSA